MFDDLITTSENGIAGAIGAAVSSALAPGGGLMAQEMARNFGSSNNPFALGPFCVGLGFFALGSAMIVFSFGEDAVRMLEPIARQLAKAPPA